jgi:alpha-D-xyloside xylohydrolase
MKFTDGFWRNRDNVSVYNAAMAYEAVCDDQSVTVYAPYAYVTNRGQTLQGPVITVRYSSPMPEVIRVQAWHYQGAIKNKPGFALSEQACPVEIRDQEDAVELQSGRLKVRIRKGEGWQVDFYDNDRYLTGSGWRCLGYVINEDKQAYMKEQLSLEVGECVYGMGERFTPFVKNGQVVDVWNADGGTSSELAYKNIPFYLTNNGYGVFVNDPGLVSYEVASEVVSRVQFSVPGEYLEYLIINGPTPKEVLERYTALTGRPSLPPAWSFGLWLTTSFVTQYNEETVNHFVDGMAQREIPLHVFHFDCFWMKEYNWTNLEWDKRQFPDPEGMLRRLKDRGLKICVWINPYIAQRSSLFTEGMEKGYLLKKPNGEVYQVDTWQPGMAFVDFTNPEACKWFAEKLKALVDMGVDCFKTDFGERIPTDCVYYDGSDPVKMHNYYTYLYNKVVFEVLEEKLGRQEAILFARSATAGGQKFPVHWGGDCTANYRSMAESLRGGLSLSLSGFGFWSHDISGFENTATPDLYKRWSAFGLLSSHSRLHGNMSYRVPWLFDEEAVDVLRHFTRLKLSLMPYLYAAAHEATEKGIPMMRAMLLEFPEDPACDYLDRQYMLGERILVAPIFNDKGMASYYLPQGTWTHLLSNATAQGGQWLREVYDYFSLPLWVRENSLIPTGSNHVRPDYDYTDNTAFHLFALKDGASASCFVYAEKGNNRIEAKAIRKGETINFTVTTAHKPWTLVLRNIEKVFRVEGGAAEPTPQGLRIAPAHGSSTLVIHL